MNGPILKDAVYFGFWGTVLVLGLAYGGAVIYLGFRVVWIGTAILHELQRGR